MSRHGRLGQVGQGRHQFARGALALGERVEQRRAGWISATASKTSTRSVLQSIYIDAAYIGYSCPISASQVLALRSANQAQLAISAMFLVQLRCSPIYPSPRQPSAPPPDTQELCQQVAGVMPPRTLPLRSRGGEWSIVAPTSR